MYDKSQQGKGKRLGDTDEEERWRQGARTMQTSRLSPKKPTKTFKKGGMVKGNGRDYCK